MSKKSADRLIYVSLMVAVLLTLASVATGIMWLMYAAWGFILAALLKMTAYYVKHGDRGAPRE